MKLLFDQNLSHKLVGKLATEFPNSKHVRDFALEEGEDWEIWALAASQDFTITSKDSDFYQRSLIQGHPPKVIWLKVGNVLTSVVENLLRQKHAAIEAFAGNDAVAILVLS